jgi:hypothetical protein
LYIVSLSVSIACRTSLCKQQDEHRRKAIKEDILQIQLLPMKAPGHYQVKLSLAQMSLFGGPAVQPLELAASEEVLPIRTAYEQQIAMVHELEALGLAVPPSDPQKLRLLGQRVARLLPPMAQQGIRTAVQRAKRRRYTLKILFEVTEETQHFLAVPWELMVLPMHGTTREDHNDGGAFLLLDATIHFVRQLRGAGQLQQAHIQRPLTVQVIVAQPNGGQFIDVSMTRTALEAVLPPLEVAASWYEGVGTLAAVQERLRNTNPQILHLLCHTEESPTTAGTRYDMILTHQDGLIQRVSGSELAPLLSLAPQLQMVLLETCYAGTLPKINPGDDLAAQAERERQASESIALALLRQGVPVVVAMQGAVSQQAAGVFVQTLYQELAKGKTVDWAVASGRIAVHAFQGAIDWTMPVVYAGYGPTERTTWYTRIADRIDAALSRSAAGRMLRALFIIWGLVLVVVGITRWVMAPTLLSADFEALKQPMLAWVLIGLIGPAVIALLQRGARDRVDLSAALRRAARRAQWGGAYLGYGLGGLVGLTGWISLWSLGLFAPPAASLSIICLIGALLLALGFSYVIARSQWQSALAIAPVDASTFSRFWTAVLIVASIIILSIPLILLYLPVLLFAGTLPAEAVAYLVALVLFTFVRELDT